MIEDYEDAVEPIKLYVEKIVADESKDEMREFLDLTTLRQRMQKKNVIDVDYLDPYIGWSRARFVAVNRDEDGELETVTLVVEGIK